MGVSGIQGEFLLSPSWTCYLLITGSHCKLLKNESSILRCSPCCQDTWVWSRERMAFRRESDKVNQTLRREAAGEDKTENRGVIDTLPSSEYPGAEGRPGSPSGGNWPQYLGTGPQPHWASRPLFSREEPNLTPALWSWAHPLFSLSSGIFHWRSGEAT